MALPKTNAAGIANRADPDQTAPWSSGSALFAQTYLSENRIIMIDPDQTGQGNHCLPFCLYLLNALLYDKTILFKF